MTRTGNRLAFVLVFSVGLPACAGRIGHIELSEQDRTCVTKVSKTIKVHVEDYSAKYRGMAWVVSNQCANDPAQVQVADFKKNGSSGPAPVTCSTDFSVSLGVGQIGIIACTVKNDVLGKYKYSVKLDGKTVVDPEVIIKR